MNLKVLFAPWRLGYIKKGAQPENPSGCVFCEALEKGAKPESLLLHKGQYASVILNKFPYNNGHTMVIPNRHVGDPGLLTEEEFTEIHQLLFKTLKTIQKAYTPQGLNIGMNVGRTGGAGIAEHLHYHLVPRWNGDTNFMPVIGQTKVISETLEQTYQRLLTSFS